jgi:hypothetical protein
LTILKPYVGVAGFMSTHEIMAAIETMPKNPRHNLAIGILASAKTLNGETNKYPNRYPKIEDIAAMIRPAREFVDANKLPVEFVLHYAVDHAEGTYASIDRAREVAEGANLDGIQINDSPHEIAGTNLGVAIHKACKRSPQLKRWIMQLRPSRANESFVDLIQTGIVLGEREQGDDTVLLVDASAGRGIALNGQTASTIIQGIRSGLPKRYQVGLGVAGGLRPGKMGVLRELMQVHGPLSFDVESGVRGPNDNMSVFAMQAYLREAWELVGTNET